MNLLRESCVGPHALERLASWVAALGLALLSGCATAPPPPPPNLLHDELFTPVKLDIDAGDLFVMSDEMQRYSARELTTLASYRDPRRALIDALYSDRKLRLAYDGGQTRTAAQAFASRSGNCLSLVIMTAAFAHHLGLPVSYQSVQVGDFYSRQGDLILASGHVNLVLSRPPARALIPTAADFSLIVDFLPQSELRGQRTSDLQEATVVAMYMNNRAAEALGEGRLDEAYAWVSRALQVDPQFLMAANTLGVIYARSGHGAQAEEALRYVLLREPDTTSALSNLVGLLGRAGRAAEAQALSARLEQLLPVPPFHYFDLGRQAMAAGEPRRALQLFMRELRVQPYQDEVQFWIAQAHWQLNEPEQAARYMRLAMENSSTQAGHARYAAKLDHLRKGSLR